MVGFGLDYACAHIIILAEISSENLLPIRADFVTERVTQCADNAHRISSSMSVSCTSSGSWCGKTPQCECDIGYHAVTVDGMQICQTQGKHFSIFWSTLVCLFLPYSCNFMSS